MVKKLRTTFLLSILLLLASTNVKAAEVEKNQIVATDKVWIIHFNEQVSLDDLSKQEIAIRDSRGIRADVTLSLAQDDKDIVITPPKFGYIAYERYKLTVSIGF